MPTAGACRCSGRASGPEALWREQNMGTAIIIGVGPDQGLGAQLCKRFAAEGLHVMVAGRTQSALDAVAADIESDGGRATAVVADATHEADIVSLFDKAGSDLEVAIYNAGNNT